MAHTLSNSTFYDGSELSHRSSTLPRRHHRRHMSSESTFVISSRDCSPVRRRSPVYSNGSLPRSTHSIPATSTQSKALRNVPNKHVINEQNRLTAKSGEIYRSPKRLGTLDRGYRPLNSGPSSVESGKHSMLNSGPSSIDSGKVSYSRTSGISSFDSHASTSTITTNSTQTARSSYFSGSPKFSSRHLLGTSKLAIESPASRTKSGNANIMNGTTRRVLDEIPVLGKPPPSSVPNSNSNSSITLQVTTSNESSIPNTKIFVQNSPVRSVITLENGKLAENSNVYIINNETTTNANGELIKRSISKHERPARTSSRDKENEFCMSETEAASETGDSLSFISETSPESSIMPTTTTTPEPCIETTKFTKNINNDATMNNGRKFSLPISNANSNIVYKNLLKTVPDTSPVSPRNNKNLFISDDHDKQDSPLYEQMAGSVGNLRYNEKNEKKLNSNCDLSKLNSNPAINTDSIAHLLQKNMIAVGSEPNLAINGNANDCRQKMNCDKSLATDKHGGGGCGIDRRYSASKETGLTTPNELYNFPSLTDLSFNFTSLAAQKILQGVSLNSIDTLVELNMAQEKQQNNVAGTPVTPAICTDYGLV